MTALAGLWRFSGRPDAVRDCDRMLAAQKIYGPHDASSWDGGSVALGRALYRLLPEDSHDRQPLHGAGGRLVLVADIRLDNRDELLPALGLSAGQELCDAAILLAAFERWGEGCLDRILGDFAFALWNAQSRQLLLARDPLGQRPLHYHRGADMLAFASMPKGLHALPEIPRAPDEERVAEFMVLLPEQGTRTFFRDIARVEVGQIVTITPGAITARRYWEPARKPIRLRSRGEYEEALRHHMDSATRARLRGAYGSIGAHLSAGMDSSIVATTAARVCAPLGMRVTAFTGAPREGYQSAASGLLTDESAHAAMTAAMHANIDHVIARSPARSPLEDLDRYFYLFEQPITNLCNGGWANAINDAARDRGLTVMLAGFLGNMTISYNGVEALPKYLGRGRLLRWAREVIGLARSGHMPLKSALVQSVGPYLTPSLWIWLNRTFGSRNYNVTFHSAINPRRLEDLDLPARARARNLDLSYRPRKDDFTTRLWVLRRVDLGNFNKGTLAGWGIDQRDPTADRRLVEFCLNVPAEQFLAGGITRALGRRAFADRVPAAVLAEQRRGRQGADWHEHLDAARGQVTAEIGRLEESEQAARALNLPRLRALVENWPKDGWEKDSTMVSYRLALLRAIATGHFLRKTSGGNQ